MPPPHAKGNWKMSNMCRGSSKVNTMGLSPSLDRMQDRPNGLFHLGFLLEASPNWSADVSNCFGNQLWVPTSVVSGNLLGGESGYKLGRRSSDTTDGTSDMAIWVCVVLRETQIGVFGP